MKYRKRPVVIDAVRVSDINGKWDEMPKWLSDGYYDGRLIFGENKVSVLTLEGTMLALADDWIIRGVKGEFYPCKPDIFAELYELADEGGPTQ